MKKSLLLATLLAAALVACGKKETPPAPAAEAPAAAPAPAAEAPAAAAEEEESETCAFCKSEMVDEEEWPSTLDEAVVTPDTYSTPCEDAPTLGLG